MWALPRPVATEIDCSSSGVIKKEIERCQVPTDPCWSSVKLNIVGNMGGSGFVDIHCTETPRRLKGFN